MSKKRQTVSATPQGLVQAQKALKLLFEIQLNLAKNLEGSVGRSTIQKFFKGEEIQVDKFKEICKALKLESQWAAIAGLIDLSNSVDLPDSQSSKQALEEQDSSLNIDALVEEVRKKIKPLIQEHCGTMQVLDMTEPIGLGDIYTDVNILEKITGRRRLTISELKQIPNPNSENFDRYGLGKVEKRVLGLQAVNENSKLMVWGKPGSGKTTFLKYLAIHCINGDFQTKRVPIFITLKDFAEADKRPDLLTFISQYLARCKVTSTEILEFFKKGRILILLDGLDEIKEVDINRVITQIIALYKQFSFSEQFPRDYHIYYQQILEYYKKYYKEKHGASKSTISYEEALDFLQKEFPENCYKNHFIITCRIAARDYTFEGFTEVEIADFNEQQIQNFAKKWFKQKDPAKADVFVEKLGYKNNKPIKELANSPLLLTLLCLVFEETVNFPQNRSELYKEGLDVLLKKWDAKRNIERAQVYKKLSLKRKEDLLSYIALLTFEEGNSFFKQKEVERYITEYIQNLPEASTDPEALQLDSEAVLKSIEAQYGLFVERARGIYSFSHLTFHEYFAARKLAINANPYAMNDQTLQALATHITEKRWREVFLLTVGMLESADKLLQLMKQQIDLLLANDQELQKFLTWIEQKSKSQEAPYKHAAVRALNFYRNLDLDLDLDLALDLDPTRSRSLARDPALARRPRSVQQLKDQLPKQNDKEAYEAYNDWQFINAQKELLKQYYDANKLLVDCLNSDCYVSREVRQEIEDTLLLPVKR